jgi:DNA-binding beta-propeller fold protein YncE
MKSRSAWIVVAVIAIAGVVGFAQSELAPVNDRPNPYQPGASWGALPDRRQWGAVTAVDIDRDGRSIWVLDRCGAESCIDSPMPPVLKLDAAGRVQASFGEGRFLVPHGLHVDREGNVWVTDTSDGTPGATRGHQVFKFGPDGRLLMTLGQAGRPGNGPDTFNRPSDVLVAPNGDIFVADGHRGNSNDRIVKFSKDGRFLKTWGRKGSGPGEFDLPHSLAMDSQGRLFVADLWNHRIQIFDQDGRFLTAWTQFGQPGGLFIDRGDMLYVSDSLSGKERHPGWRRGIRIGNAKNGEVTAFIPDPTPDVEPITAAEAVAADVDGNVFGAVVPARRLLKYARGQTGR